MISRHFPMDEDLIDLLVIDEASSLREHYRSFPEIIDYSKERFFYRRHLMKDPDTVTKHNFSQEYLDYDISRQIELESYGYRFLRLNKFNLWPEQSGETKADVLDRLLKRAFAIE